MAQGILSSSPPVDLQCGSGVGRCAQSRAAVGLIVAPVPAVAIIPLEGMGGRGSGLAGALAFSLLSLA
eukprot:16444626-Heterocapsa_arctica.AAC.1